MRLAGGHSLGVDLNDCGSGNNVLIREVGARLGQHDVSLALDAGRDPVNLIVAVALGDADLDVEFLEAGEEDGVDGGVFCAAQHLGRFEGARESYRGAIGFVVVPGALEGQFGESHEGKLDWAGAPDDERAGYGVDLVEVQGRVEWIWEW